MKTYKNRSTLKTVLLQNNIQNLQVIVIHKLFKILIYTEKELISKGAMYYSIVEFLANLK